MPLRGANLLTRLCTRCRKRKCLPVGDETICAYCRQAASTASVSRTRERFGSQELRPSEEELDAMRVIAEAGKPLFPRRPAEDFKRRVVSAYTSHTKGVA